MKTVCDVLGVARSNVYERVKRPTDWRDRRPGRRVADDERTLTELKEVIEPLPSYGYLTRVCAGESHQSNRRWCSDGFEISCDTGERVRVAFALDCYEREAMSWVATTAGIDGDLVRDLMVEAVEARFGAALPNEPIEWLTDNGSPYVAGDTRRFAKTLNLVALTTAIRCPQSNGMAESFVKTFKRDYVGEDGSTRCAARARAVAKRLRALQRRASAFRA